MARAKLVMTQKRHQEIFDHLFPGDGLEAAAVLLCNQGTGKKHRRLIAADTLLAPHDTSDRKRRLVTWPFADCLTPETVTRIDQLGQSIITIHSHPNSMDGFSAIDDRNDKELFHSVCNWFDDQRLNGSAIMLPDGRIRARTVNGAGKFTEMESVCAAGDSIRLWKRHKSRKKKGYERKLAQTFGAGTLDLLRNMRAGVVGCSGTGSVMIELLVRNSVGTLVIVDPDTLEEKNLNRMIGGTMDDVRKKRPKVKVVERAVQAMGMGTKVQVHQDYTDSADVVAALVDCDILFGCVDSAFGRYHLDCLASAYLIPYFDVGVHLEADGEGGITAADAVSHYVHPEGRSLLARGAYSMEQVTAENLRRTDSAHYREQREAGYLAAVGEEQPAVMSINMQVACMAFNDFLARIHKFRLDDNGEFATQRFRLTHGAYENETDQGGTHPLMEKYVGAGDGSLLVKNNVTHA